MPHQISELGFLKTFLHTPALFSRVDFDFFLFVSKINFYKLCHKDVHSIFVQILQFRPFLNGYFDFQNG